MKARIAAVLSLTGVLAAGSAAALVNTKVLESDAKPSSVAGPAAESFGSTTTVSLPTSSERDDDQGDDDSTTSTTTGSTEPTVTAAPSASQAAYQVGDSGIVTLDTAGGQLTIVSVVPSPGWQVAKAENDDTLKVEVQFSNGSILVEFKANLLFGVISTSVESQTISSDDAPSSNTATPSKGTVDDHGDDDDDHSGSDHDDDDHSGSDHDDDSHGDDDD